MKSEIDSDFSKSKGQKIFEYVLFIVCLCIIALRVTITEGIPVQSALQPVNLGSPLVSLLISGLLIFLVIIWFIWNFTRRRFSYHFSGMEIGLFLFIAAGLAAGFIAANKRAVITEMIIVTSPLFTAILLTQILDTQAKVKLVLIVIAALGIVSAYQCSDQFFTGNQMTIGQYESLPESILEPLGIEPGSFEQMLFEHRLYSRGISGFFTTSNSAGSFAVLALFAGLALLLEKFRSLKAKQTGFKSLLFCFMAFGFILFGLVITRSKGAVLAAAVAVAAFLVYLCFAGWIKKHRKLILILLLVLAAVGSFLLVSYGLANNRLPGGNSMLVRWQYWAASAKMYAAHWLTGVGPGNFPYFYTHYKPDAALESVADPHNFLLSILSQYGLLGLVGFLAMIFIPVWRILFSETNSWRAELDLSGVAFKKSTAYVPICIAICLLVFRPIVLPLKGSASFEVLFYAIFVLYISTAAVFLVGFWLLSNDIKTTNRLNSEVTSAALICGIAAVLLHNLIDFAIFEPGVSMTLWTILACLIVLYRRKKSQEKAVKKTNNVSRILTAIAGGLLFSALLYAYFAYALIPVARASKLQRQAMSEPEDAHELLAEATESDPLAHSAAKLNGRLYLWQYNQTGKRKALLLQRAAECFRIAIERNKADYKDYEYLAKVYVLLAECSVGSDKEKLLRIAFDTAGRAVAFYPGNGRLRLRLAEIAEKLKNSEIALAQYKKAVEIEDAYREQFRIMYPGSALFSRLGKEKYNLAKERIRKLSSLSAD